MAPVKVRDDCRVAPTGRLVTDRVKIIFVISGRTRFQHAERVVDLSAGAVVIVPSRQWCASTPDGFARTVTLYVRQELVEAAIVPMPAMRPFARQLREATGRRGRLGLLTLSEHAVQVVAPKLLLLVVQERQADDPIGLLPLLATIIHNVDLLAGVPHAGTGSIGERSRLRQEVASAVRTLREDPAYPWTVAELAASVALSQSQLTRLFRAELMTSPGAYLWQLRTDKMAELLSTTTLDATSAAKAVGWAHPSAASRSFRRRFGMTPGEFARRIGTAGTSVLEASSLEQVSLSAPEGRDGLGTVT